jgi:putative FmdB family regulatory protein
MPLYEYRCEACGKRFEVIQKFSDPPVDACTACGQGPVVRLLSSPAIQFKGSGWYITDYAKKGTADGAKTESTTDTAKSDSKTEGGAKTETAAKTEPAGKSTTTSDKP